MRQHYKIFEGAGGGNLPDVAAVETPFLEQGFVVMRASFADWFFSKILEENSSGHGVCSGTLNRSDFGPDLLGCAAAHGLKAKNYSDIDHVF